MMHRVHRAHAVLEECRERRDTQEPDVMFPGHEDDSGHEDDLAQKDTQATGTTWDTQEPDVMFPGHEDDSGHEDDLAQKDTRATGTTWDTGTLWTTWVNWAKGEQRC